MGKREAVRWIRRGIAFRPDTLKTLDGIAREDRRTRSNMVRVLVEQEQARRAAVQG
jgi:hypothetical protein